MIRNGATRQNVLFRWKEVLQDERRNNLISSCHQKDISPKSSLMKPELVIYVEQSSHNIWHIADDEITLYLLSLNLLSTRTNANSTFENRVHLAIFIIMVPAQIPVSI